MATIQPTLTIAIDDKTFDVTDMSPAVQRLVSFLDDWRQDEADQVSALLKTQSALRDIQNELLTTIQGDLAERVAPAPDAEPQPTPQPKPRNKKAAK